jgi:hypothetical protein
MLLGMTRTETGRRPIAHGVNQLRMVLHSPVNYGVQVTPVENNKAIPNQPRRNRQSEITKPRRMPPYQRPG